MLSHSLHYQNLSTEIKTPSLNCYCYFPWPSHINQTSGNTEWDVFKDRGFYFIPIYIISISPKIEEIRRIACLSNAPVN